MAEASVLAAYWGYVEGDPPYYWDDCRSLVDAAGAEAAAGDGSGSALEIAADRAIEHYWDGSNTSDAYFEHTDRPVDKCYRGRPSDGFRGHCHDWCRDCSDSDDDGQHCFVDCEEEEESCPVGRSGHFRSFLRARHSPNQHSVPQPADQPRPSPKFRHCH